MTDYTILTNTGRIFDFGDLEASEISIIDIAHNLARLCRFVGGVSDFYSVAEHSVRVAALCAPGNQLRGLLHDAHEAYTGDMNAPLKRLPELAAYRALERQVDEVVLGRFGLTGPQPDEVSRADKILRLTEQRDLRDAQPVARNTTGLTPLPLRIVPLPHRAAQILFLSAFNTLESGRYLQPDFVSYHPHHV